jgi:2-keto-4-pentenoate hydratase/2-oxohepta-3-ene-1,7-dioic acid hydratase in catechol pathway
MAALVVRFRLGEAVRWGVLEGPAPGSGSDRLVVAPLLVEAPLTSDLIAAFEAGAPPAEAAIEIEASELLAPITSDATLVCQGLNYQTHSNEAQQSERKSNLLFAKASSSLTGPYAPIIRPPEVELLDYEVEFALVLRTALTSESQVTEETLGDWVAGVALCNDVTARDVQFGETFLQWFRGKSFRTFCPAGPTLLLLNREEVRDALDNLEIKLWVNGDLRQQASSRQLIWKPAESLAYVASLMDMKRGDLLLTGTPGGVTAPATPRMIEIIKTHLMSDEARRRELREEMTKGRPFLRKGDLVLATLRDTRTGRSLGSLANLVDEPA